jgi:hypothetical protein
MRLHEWGHPASVEMMFFWGVIGNGRVRGIEGLGAVRDVVVGLVREGGVEGRVEPGGGCGA